MTLQFLDPTSISKEFEIKDIGAEDLILEVKIYHCNDFISIDKQHLISYLLRLYVLDKCNPVLTPLPPQTHMGTALKEKLVKFKSLKVNYPSAIGSIDYLSTATLPDLSHAVRALSQFLESPRINNWDNFLHILEYLNGSQNIGLVYSWGSKEGVRAYSNMDWGNFQETHFSLTGFLVTFEGSLVIWKTRKQLTVSISTAEAEYKELCYLMSELVWFQQWCHEFSLSQVSKPIPIHEENQSCINTV
ncbi:hypothetical protein O181_109812 [Austropuccinia psidii MF-1]|uniref:Reverse transcriptase Ty1/copia-type domain-containing protein n=1 Tax=Austropuccinia psidii MF-1 TaxID=1389203 RepID=A0A9Q3PRR2_9BASI|nr:hypothetical protein [Austropuccinia psidii MF-1]